MIQKMTLHVEEALAGLTLLRREGFGFRARVGILLGLTNFPFCHSSRRCQPVSVQSLITYSQEHESKSLIMLDLIEETFRLSLWREQW